MRTYKSRLLAGLAAALTLAGAVGSASAQQNRQPSFKSPETAYEQGLSAWRSGFIELAIPAFRYAADHDVFHARYYLARILADSSTPYTDHVAAYQLYLKIAADFADIDPDSDRRKVFVARSLTALANYVRQGLPQAGLRPDPRRAVEYLRHAAQFFNDEEAQFELGKIYIQGDGVRQDVRAGLHWLSTLTQRGHAGAQAFLADILWRGRYNLKRDPTRALALIQVAVENAPDSERVWIEEIYHNIYCGAPEGTRSQAQAVVADWQKRYNRTVNTANRSALGALPPAAERTCSNGEAVPPTDSIKRRQTAGEPSAPQAGMLGVGVTTTLTPR
jgi:TPR repeat protein